MLLKKISIQEAINLFNEKIDYDLQRIQNIEDKTNNELIENRTKKLLLTLNEFKEFIESNGLSSVLLSDIKDKIDKYSIK